MTTDPIINNQPRKLPNILITGTPGTGKTTTSELLSIATGLRNINVGTIVKEKGCHEGVDKEFDAFILDEDKLVDEMEDMMSEGGNIVDFHSCDFFPERWFDLVVVLRTYNEILYPRLEKRNYTQHKIQENVEAEIMQVVLEEAQTSYKKEIVVEFMSNTVEEMEDNVNKLEDWVEKYKASHQ